MYALLISTYEMGRQPFGLASPCAWLRGAGWEVTCVDAAKQPLHEEVLAAADLIAFHLPMHTATRLAAPLIETARRLNPSARICAYGLYAPLNGGWLKTLGVDEVLGAEFEEELTAIARKCSAGLQACQTANIRTRPILDVPVARTITPRTRSLPRLRFLVPDRSGLPPLDRYATLQLADGRRKLVGYTEASRGCRHRCRHCPVVPVYDGHFRVVQADVVLADIAQQIRAGAEHITFGDPDFFNGPTHAVRIVEAMHRAHPGVTYDATIKIEHLLKHSKLLPRLQDAGCLFLTSAVESIDDRVLALLDKGHTRQDFVEAVSLCRDTGVTLVPTFVAFHPWMTLDNYCDLVETIEALGLVDCVAPIQLAIRLLIPEGSRLLELDEVRGVLSGFDGATLTYRWSHPDSRVEDLHEEVTAVVGARLADDRRAIFDRIATLAHRRAGTPRVSPKPPRDRATVPYLNEPWYC